MDRPCPVIALDNVTVVSQASGQSLLRSITLDIPKGSLVGIASAAAGETTAFLEVLARHIQPTTGTLTYDTPNKAKYVPTVSATWEEKGFYPDWSLFDNVFLGVPHAWHEELWHTGAMHDRVERLYKELGVSLIWHQRCHHLSPQERAIVLIVRAFLRPATLYLFNRTLDALDERTLLRVLEKLRTLTPHASTVFSTGRLQDIRHLCTKVLLISCGRTTFYGAPNAISPLGIECRLINSTSSFRKVITRELYRERHEAEEPDIFIRRFFYLLTTVLGKNVSLFCLYQDLQRKEHFIHTPQTPQQDDVGLHESIRPFLDRKHVCPPTWPYENLEYRILPLRASEFMAQRGTASTIIAVFGWVIPVLPFDVPLESLLNDFSNSLCSIMLERDLESRIKHRERLDSLGMLASGVAHDFNNSLFTIQGATTILQKKMKDPTLIRFLDIILRATDSAGSLTQKLLSFSQKGTTTFQDVDLHLVIKDAISLLHSGISNKVHIELKLDAQHSRIFGDAAELRNMVVNIGLNAIQALDLPTGIVVFSTTNIMTTGALQAAGDIQPPILELTVTDNGPGIQLDVLDRIFEPFVSTKLASGGNGLGLSVVYGTVKEHKGSISAQNAFGGGAKFVLQFPIYEAHATPVPTEVSPILPHARSRILICDDDNRVRIVLAALLEELGHEVTSTSSGPECIDVFRTKKDLFHVILLDDLMPGMSGRACFEHLRAICPKVKVLIISGYRQSDYGDDMTKIGISGFLRKPVRLEELSKTLEAVLSKG